MIDDEKTFKVVKDVERKILGSCITRLLIMPFGFIPTGNWLLTSLGNGGLC